MVVWVQRIIIDFLDIIKILIVCTGIINIPLKKSNKHIITAFCLLIVSSYIKWSLYDSNNLDKFLLLWMLISIVLIMLCLLEIRSVKGILFFLLLFFINGNLDGIADVIIYTFSRSYFEIAMERLSIYSSLITVTFLSILVLSVKSSIKGNYSNVSFFQLIMLVTISFFNSIVLSFLVEYLNKTRLITKDKMLTFVIMGIALGIYLQIGLFIFLCMNTGFYRERNYLNICYLEAQKKQYRYLQEKEEATRHFRHDMKNHIFVLKDLCYSQNWEKMNLYIERMSKENLKGSNYHIETGNHVIDAICNKYLEEAENMGISVVISGHIPDKTDIEDFDLCTIFANLLSNAIEAVQFSDKKDVSLDIRYDEACIYIKEENYYINLIKKKGKKILTIKPEKDIHGFGIQNIKNSVYRYGGEVEIDTKNKTWMVLISIPYHISRN